MLIKSAEAPPAISTGPVALEKLFRHRYHSRLFSAPKRSTAQNNNGQFVGTGSGDTFAATAGTDTLPDGFGGRSRHRILADGVDDG